MRTTSPGKIAAALALLTLADLIITVLLADVGSAPLIPQVLSSRLYGRGTMAARLVERTVVLMNQVELDSALSTDILDRAMNTFGQRLLGAVCWDDALGDALVNRRLLLNGGSGAAEDLTVVTDSLLVRVRPSTRPPPLDDPGIFPALSDWGLR